MDPLTIRRFDTLADYQACCDLQEEIWGQGFSERVSAAILKVANRIGGLSAGAFDKQGVLQGFVFGLTGLMDGRLVHWSDMLGVRPGTRDRGLGTRLKCYQRETLLEGGIQCMHWTFDPLQGRNAYVNFAKLGILTAEYSEDMYGQTDSPLHRGVGTDRLVARWELTSRRVVDRLAGEVWAPTLEEAIGRAGGGISQLVTWRDVDGFPVPGDVTMDREESELLLAVPGDLDRIMEVDLPLAVRWREITREPFLHYLSRGYEIREFLREGLVSHYLLVREDDMESTSDGVAP